MHGMGRRTDQAVFVVVFMLSVLATAFFQTQVLDGARFAARARENRLRPVPIPAPRGTLVDREGRVVATSVTAYSVSILPGDPATVGATLRDLAPFLGLAGEEVRALARRRDARPNDLLAVTDRATFAQVAAVQERSAAFPNVLVVERPRRWYPAGAAAGHLTGYVGEITRDQLARPELRDAGYRAGRVIGQSGIEKEYELTLAGQDGARYVEVDARGRVVDPSPRAGSLAPQPGRTLRLTLDLALQEYVHRIFPDTMNGALVAMVPGTGEILALYSAPGYDPNAFVGAPSPAVWRQVSGDPRHPLLDRAVAAVYPPASTWKLATAAMGVRRGMVTATTHMPIPCTGGMLYAGRYARCESRTGHGSLDLAEAVARSCNVYFYQLGIRLGLETLLAEGTRMGFGRRTGVDLPGEVASVFPSGVAALRRRQGHVAPSEVMSFAIGQGGNAQTVVGMARFYAALAGDGTARSPHLVAGAPARVEVDLGLDAARLETLWAGLASVTAEGGTAAGAALARWKVYGKTGTAQNSQGADHGWFVGFAGPPGGHPEIVVAAIVEHGEHGASVAPLATRVMEHYLARRHALVPDPRPTLVERWADGRMPYGQYDRYPAPVTPVPARHAP